MLEKSSESLSCACSTSLCEHSQNATFMGLNERLFEHHINFFWLYRPSSFSKMLWALQKFILQKKRIHSKKNKGKNFLMQLQNPKKPFQKIILIFCVSLQHWISMMAEQCVTMCLCLFTRFPPATVLKEDLLLFESFHSNMLSKRKKKRFF